MPKIIKHSFKESDTARLNDLAKEHSLTFRRTGMVYRFEDFTAYGLDQALGYAEGFDRAIAACKGIGYKGDVDDNEFMAPFTIQGPWKVVVNPETAASKFPMTPMLVAVRDDGLAIYSHCEPYVDKYYMGWSGKIPVTVVGCPPFGEVIRMADERWPFQKTGSDDA
jgi:hypothetical protein